MIKKGIFLKLVVGNTHLCKLDLNNDTTIALLSLGHIEQRDLFMKKSPAAFSLLKEIKAVKHNLGILTIFCLDAEYYVVVQEPRNFSKVSKATSQKVKCLSVKQAEGLLSINANYARILLILGFEEYYEILKVFADRLRGPLEFKHNG